MTPADLRAWKAHMGYTHKTAAEALGISRSGFAKLLAGDHPIDKRTALACAAVAAGLDVRPNYREAPPVGFDQNTTPRNTSGYGINSSAEEGATRKDTPAKEARCTQEGSGRSCVCTKSSR